MHVPEKWRLDSPEQITRIIQQFSFAVVVSPSLEASHVPLVYNAQEHCLTGHIAANDRHKKESEGSSALAIFSGPHAYIEPNWYQDGPAVPTWNYVAIHIHGKLHWLDEEQTLQGVRHLVSKYQPDLLQDQDLMPEEYQQKLVKGIRGFRIDIDAIEAKAKLGQHRNDADQRGVVEGLMKSNNSESQQLLAIMEQLDLGLGK